MAAIEGQVVAANAHDEVPWIEVRGAKRQRVALLGNAQATVSGARVCIGQDGPCPTQTPVQRFSQCLSCIDLPSPECVFEPLCQQGASCSCAVFDVPHVVYVAFYATLPKVGMTTRHRFQTRIQEQGADAAFIAAGETTILSRGAARAEEERLSKLHGLPQWRRGKEMVRQLARPANPEAIAQKASQWQQKLGVQTELYMVPPTSFQPSGPVAMEAWPNRLNGTWLGGKGRWVMMEPGAQERRLATGLTPRVAYNIQDLVGRTVSGQFGALAD